ncbi:thioredoxin reductase [Toxoplasma gondii ME49]|uniref:Thioredoxin reductase n=2 Tax=Toxoplasma gondii TaxID=5811 RepID=B6KA42_TOXGV|nr:thioredoxin reductase [Toxoplasma gondii ME49]EPT26266.1 thioredoxin reductase [Toxoplasma gondii ME49]ESS34794.1 thioredoxin reductase [Toxoplasma gondii VEG]CEL77275.1 TPA: thioredoxin reductase, putative [Toxoplasma gondii VEG]|eukprot:XP_002364220.1 thioredoxin reductase [Toxoplasma gondii ME49]
MSCLSVSAARAYAAAAASRPVSASFLPAFSRLSQCSFLSENCVLRCTSSVYPASHSTHRTNDLQSTLSAVVLPERLPCTPLAHAAAVVAVWNSGSLLVSTPLFSVCRTETISCAPPAQRQQERAFASERKLSVISTNASEMAPTNTNNGAPSCADGEFDYDLAVIGGGSGGLACAKMAAAQGAETVVFDFVQPSTQGSTWGLGGTCVNVGCVPKYLFHHTGLAGANAHWDGPHMGWKGKFEEQVDWGVCVEKVQNYIKSLNFGYRTGLRKAGVTYINAYAKFVSPHELAYTFRGEDKICKARNIVVAVGGRPHIPEEVEGAKELAITSDDIFSLKQAPNKTLCVGASYISLECAGFLRELGFDVTVAVRSILLRGFDRQCAEQVGLCLEEAGVRILRETIPAKMVKQANGKIQVTFQVGKEKKELVEEFDTVLYATGRKADTSNLNLQAAGVETTETGKIVCDGDSHTSAPSVYAIGDAVENFPELTPVAIKAGEILARRLFANSTEHMDFTNIPTTVFTPIEYAHTGYSEEAAEAEFGRDDLEVYLFQFSPLFFSCVHREKAPQARKSPEDVDITPPCLAKLICVKSEDEKVVGIHFVGPNAGELMQGFALAVRLGAKKRDFDKCVGIHPTNAEAFMALTVTKASGEPFVASGGCGGGKCG